MAPVPPAPEGRFLVAFGDGAEPPSMWTWDADWERVDAHPNLVTSYTIDRGRQYELDRTDTGRATVEIADTDGILDPTNPAGPYYGRLEPLLQATIGRHDPITDTWHTRFRGFVEDFDYAFDPSQRVNRLTVQLVDIFEVVSAIEMLVGQFGDQPPSGSESPDVVYFHRTDTAAEVRGRIEQILGDARIPVDYYVLFSGNVALFETVYSPGESVMTAIAEAADAEFPGVANVYTDRRGRLCFHGRMARFTPEDIALEAGPDRWDWNTWDVGDRTAVLADPANCSQIRRFAYNRGLAKVINHATATPIYSNARQNLGQQLTIAETNGQLVKDQASIDKRGIRSWSAQNLLTRLSAIDGANSLVETKRFARYYVDNFTVPRNRVTEIGFRSINPTEVGAAKLWELLTKVDISDAVSVTVDSPGGGGFLLEPFYVEGVHETCRPLGVPDYDDVDVSLDLSPRAYFDTIPPGW